MQKYNVNQLKYCKIWGRTNKTIQPLPLFWTGSGIELNVSGSELWIEVEVSYDLYEPWIAYNINGAFISRQPMHKGLNSVCIYTNKNDSEIKNIFFYKETQPFNDDANHSICIHSIITNGQFFPIKEKPYRLEFIGDSISSGEGTYGAQTEEDWLPMFMSASKNYAVHTSKMLDAEYRILSQSGWGIRAGWDNNLQHRIPPYYEQICGLAKGVPNEQTGAFLPYDFSSWKADAVIINLGTNDASALKQHHDPAFFLSEVSASIKQFLQCVRKSNPDALIIWIYGMLGNDLEQCIQFSIHEYNFTNKDNVQYLPLPNTTTDELGSRQHPGNKMHIKAAQLLKDYLMPLLISDVSD